MQSGHGSKFGLKQERAIAALLASDSLAAAATQAKVPLRTLKRWLTDETFQQHFRAARRELITTTVAQLLTLNNEAIAALKRGLTCGNPSIEIRAALAVLEQSHKHEMVDVKECLEELEAANQGRENHRW